MDQLIVTYLDAFSVRQTREFSAPRLGVIVTGSAAGWRITIKAYYTASDPSWVVGITGYIEHRWDTQHEVQLPADLYLDAMERTTSVQAAIEWAYRRGYWDGGRTGQRLCSEVDDHPA